MDIGDIIPDRILKIIKTDNECLAVISNAILTIGNILEENDLYFFPEYTNHGIKHINSVINSANSLIPDETFDKFIDPQNATALVLSILLHDLGMHCTFDTFKNLILNNKTPIINQIDKFSWKELWEKYITDFKKLSTKDKIEIYGEDIGFQNADIDFLLVGSLRNHQRLLIGEFIRKHHPRIAHEIALVGIQTSSLCLNFFDKIHETSKKDVIGLIARSHGMEIRDLYSYIDRKYGNRKVFGINIIYLMVVLRIADYLQIDQSRINRTSFLLKTFSNPISKLEHYKHVSIEFIEIKVEDPEKLFVFAQPENSFLYFKCKDLIESIQNELDRSWAILGEIYGKDIDKPLLRYRRITSNILDKEAFQETVNYIPEKILFDAHDDLSKLLVSPLYGDEPTYGVRELLQNSIDACREKSLYEKNYNPKIKISIVSESEEETANAIFTIKDNGKGMDIHEIKDYFLKAGASLRKSSIWNKENVGEDGKSLVARSGKFGVGVLAGFLIGDEIMVRTRRSNSTFGLMFKANIDSKKIEIYKDNLVAEGTEISCLIDKKALLKLQQSVYEPNFRKFDQWYTINTPQIQYFAYFEGEDNLGYDRYDPNYDDHNDDWKEFSSPSYTKLMWTYSENYCEYIHRVQRYRLTCNGIVIPNPPEFHSDLVRAPNISIFDFEGVLPLNLNRNSLNTYQLPFINDLKNSIFKELLSHYVMNETIPTIRDGTLSFIKFKQVHFNGLQSDKNELFDGYFLTNKGFIINHFFFRKFIRDKRYLKFFLLDQKESYDLKFDIKDHLVHISQYGSVYNFDKNVFERIILNSKLIEKNTKDTSKPFYQNPNIWTDENLQHMINYGWYSFKKNSSKSRNNIFLGNLNDESKKNLLAIGESFMMDKYDGNVEFKSFLSLIFTDLDDCIFPFDLDKRTKKLDELFSKASI